MLKLIFGELCLKLMHVRGVPWSNCHDTMPTYSRGGVAAKKSRLTKCMVKFAGFRGTFWFAGVIFSRGVWISKKEKPSSGIV